MKTTSVFAIDDHAIFRRGVAGLVQREPSLSWSGEAGSCAEAWTTAPELRPDVVLVNTHSPELDGVAAIRMLKAQMPSARFVALGTEVDANNARAALAAGATSYVLKSITPLELLQVIEGAARGRRSVAPAVSVALAASEHDQALGTKLTRRELTLLDLMARGLPNHEISARMAIGLPTVKFHVTNILSKLQVENRTAAVLKALRLKLVVLEP